MLKLQSQQIELKGCRGCFKVSTHTEVEGRDKIAGAEVRQSSRKLIASALDIRSVLTSSSFPKASYSQMMELLNYWVSTDLSEMKWRRGRTEYIILLATQC